MDGRAEEVVERVPVAGEGLDLREHSNGKQRVSAEVEEVVVAAYPLDAQHPLPDGGELGLAARQPARSDSSRRRRPRRSGLGRSVRSILLLGVRGRASSVTKAAGTM